MKSDPTYEDIMTKFESMGKVESRTSRNSNSRFSWTGFCILFALAVGLVVVSITYVPFFNGCPRLSLLSGT